MIRHEKKLVFDKRESPSYTEGLSHYNYLIRDQNAFFTGSVPGFAFTRFC